ncbi:hypothetical protein HU200_017764 [Digitaria exilis]|uniref:DUF6598 domain-containing protein n=1 Tax=Digitaria exilis TaxID=1010633 RepID=A0A835F6C1_9POAL|nr:hypothetical protein HU200_017764 [Digitaria exilis]
MLIRAEYDYRCIYLFRRGRDDPQLITSKDNMLTLISPIRASAARDSMFFEFELKIMGTGDVDEDFSKEKPTTKSLDIFLSTMELVYTPVPFALEASIAVSVLHGPSDFTSKVTAWTTNDENKIILYDSVVPGT